MKILKRLVPMLGCTFILTVLPGYARAAGYAETTLVSNGLVPAAFTDPNLVNPWGISFFPGASPFWVSDNNAGVATLYAGDGTPFPSPTTPLVVDIPSPTRSEEHTSELQSLRHIVCRL